MEHALFATLDISPMTKECVMNVLLMLAVLEETMSLRRSTVLSATTTRADVLFATVDSMPMLMVFVLSVKSPTVSNVECMVNASFVSLDSASVLKEHALNATMTLAVLAEALSLKRLIAWNVVKKESAMSVIWASIPLLKDHA